MTYVITSLCTNDGACVDVCPVACIHTQPGAPQFYVDPDVCIECEQCEIVCPVDAIFLDQKLPAEHLPSIEVNAGFFRKNKTAAVPVSADRAWEMIQRAHAYATSLGIAVSTAVVDESGSLIALAKMEGADPRTPELAFDKAYTAAALHVATAELISQAGKPWLRSLLMSHRGRILPAEGALAIPDGIAIIGAIGVAGAASGEQDGQCCRAAFAALENPGH